MVRSRTLTPEEFARRFKAASRALWCLAAAILGCRTLAEDVLQDAAVTALSRLETFQEGTNFDAWIGQIVRFTALNHARRHHRRREIGVDVLDHHPGRREVAEVDPGEALDPSGGHFDDAVLRALMQLGETARASFLLRVLTDLSYREIADLLGIPEGTAMSHVHRSRKALRETLEADVDFELCAAWRAS